MNKKYFIFSGSKHDENLDDLKKELELDVHRITVNELCQRLGTNLETGLTNAQARANLERDGPNSLTPPPTTPGVNVISILCVYLCEAVISSVHLGSVNLGYVTLMSCLNSIVSYVA